MCDIPKCNAKRFKSSGKVAFHVHCKCCDAVIYKRDTVYCSQECKKAARDRSWTDTKCCVCGVDVRRRIDKRRSGRFCCSVNCQRNLALVDNHSAKTRIWTKKLDSFKARKAWKSAQKKRRKKESVEYRWWRKCKLASAFAEELSDDRWMAKCRSAVATLRNRLIRKKANKKAIETWECCLKKARVKVKNHVRVKKLNGWKRKSTSVARNMRTRLEAFQGR